jgi:NAD(P)-dependent dehydrogenase (short-subunit alcohol dehydrogenase family)
MLQAANIFRFSASRRTWQGAKNLNALQGQHVVVIGGSSGMGLATAQASAHAGARVTVASRDASRLAQAVAQIGANAVAKPLDITDEAAVAQFFATIDPIDHLVMTAHASSAVTGALNTLAGMTLDAARAFVETKFWGPLVAAKYGHPRVNPAGSLLFFSGAAGSRKLLPNHTIVGATNGAVEAFARQLAREIAPKRVNVIAAGLVRTPAYDGLPEAAREGMYTGYAKSALVGRVGTPEDIADAAVFLMGNSYVTGQIHEIDGGRP